MITLRSLEKRECCLQLSEGSTSLLGRGRETGIQDSTVSSKHASLTAVRAQDGSLVLRVTAKDAVRVQLPNRSKAAKLLPGTSLQVVPGTQLFLRAHRKFGFSVEEDASPAAMDSSHESQVMQPEAKRRRHATSASDIPKDARQQWDSQDCDQAASYNSGQSKRLHKDNISQLPPANPTMTSRANDNQQQTAAGAAHQHQPLSVSKQHLEKSKPMLFHGTHVVFWERSHMRLLMDRVIQAGAILQDCIDCHTSIVISPRVLSPNDAVTKLEAIPATVTTVPFIYQKRSLQFPTGIDFVEKEYLVQCLAQDARLPAGPFRIHLQLLALHPAPEEETVEAVDPHKQDSQDEHRQDQLEAPMASGEPPSTPTTAGHEPEATSPAASPAVPERHPGMGGHGMIAQGLDMLKEVSSPLPGPRAPIRDTENSWSPSIVSHHQEDGRPQFTGGSTGIVWGSQGVWEEPWTHASALKTLQLLDANWNRLKSPRLMRDLARDMQSQIDCPSATQGDHEIMPNSDSEGAESVATERQNGSDSGGENVANVNHICQHEACAAQTTCMIAELETIRNNYTKGRDQFQIKAMERTIHAVKALEKPLARAADADELDIGGKSKDKLKEIIATGSFRRNQNQAQDEHRKTVQLNAQSFSDHHGLLQFTEVWGVAESSSERFWREGCRSLDDLRARSDLTETQVVGLRYFEDLQHRIPRSEVHMAEEIIRQAVHDVLPSGATDGASDPLCAYCMGSYLRGKPATGDIDFMLVPPASMGKVPCGPLLQKLLTRLLEVRLLVDELEPTRLRVPAEHEGSASWMGIARPPHSPHFRRIDIKVYPHRALPFVINHFTGSRDFNRALRFWAGAACQEQAKAHNRQATGFHLSDSFLCPAMRLPVEKRPASGVRDAALGPLVPASCETDIFKTMGLAYVPARMRFFGDNFQ